MTYLRVKNWERFQHADATKRGRDPVWIKNYTRLLHDDDYLDLSFAQRGILHAIWLAYASGGARELPADTCRLSRKLGAQVTRKQLDALIHAGFLEFCQDSVQTVSSLDKRREEIDLVLLDGTQEDFSTERRAQRLKADEEFMRWVANVGRHFSKRDFRLEANRCFGVALEVAEVFYDEQEVAA